MKHLIVGGLAVLAVGAASRVSVAQDIPCAPQQTSRIAICSSGCSGIYCGYNLPLAGKRHLGSFITYYTTSDGRPIDIPDGQTEAAHFMRLQVVTADASLNMYLDEIPDFAMFVQVQQENGPFFKEFKLEANENFSVDLKTGWYHLKLIHRLDSQGGRRARYVPTVYLAPTIQQDTAGGTLETARNMGELSRARPIEVTEYLQRVNKRKLDGSLTAEDLINDYADVYRVTTRTPGRIKISFNRTAVLDSNDVPTVTGYRSGTSHGVVEVPPQGLSVEAGTHYIAVETQPRNTDIEYGFKYHLQITYEPRQ